MIRIKKNNFYMCAASIAFVGLSPAAWGMDYLSSWVEGEDTVKAKVVSGLAPQILPPIQNGETIMTGSKKPACEKRLMPNSAHGIIKATFQNGDKSYEYLGEGTLIAPNLVLTTANNLYNMDIHESKPIGRAKEVKFYPTLNGQVVPFAEQHVRNFYFTEEYTKDKSENYGLLVLESPIGEMTGYMGVSVLPPERIFEVGTNITGYPGGKVENELSYYEMCQDLTHYQMNNYWNKKDSTIFHIDNNNYFVIGIHTSRDETLGLNTATFLTKPRYEKIRTWVKDSFEKWAASALKEGMFSSVESTDLQSKYIGNFGVNVLCNYAKYLHTVNLSYNNIEDDGCRPLLTLPNLTELNLSSNKIRDDGFKCLLQHPSIIDLKFSNNYITLNNTSEEFFKNSSLLYLDLSWNLIDYEGGMILAQTPYLTKLNLSNNKINDAGKVLLALAKNTRLKTLSFSNPYEVSRSGKTLAGAGKVAGMLGRTGGVVTVVAVTGGAVGLGVLGTALVLGEHLGSVLVTSALTKATLGSVLSGATSSALSSVVATQVVIAGAGTTVGAVVGVGAGTVAGIEANKSLNEMDSMESKIMKSGGKFVIGKEEAKALSENRSLTDLDLSDDYVSADIVSILLNSPTITSLNLSWNKLDDKDAKNISSILEKNKVLTCMNLQDNNIKDQEFQKNINNLLMNNIVLKEKSTPHQFFDGRKNG